jgi:uncharacterized protein
MKITRWLASLVGACILITNANAQEVIGLATTKGGATAQISTALAKVISSKSTLQVRPQVMANTSQYIPAVNQGKVEFGIANLPQTYYAVTGTGMSPGQPNPNIRLVAKLFPFAAGLVVSAKSGMSTYADLKGKRIPRFAANSLGDFIVRMCLAAGGLTYDDVTSVPIANFPRQFGAFKQGDIDTSIATVGSQVVLDFQATLGTVRFLTFKKADQPVVAKMLPGTVLRTMPVVKSNVGISADTLVFAYDYTMFTSSSVPDAIVGKVVKALIDGAAEFKASGALWAEYDVKKLYSDTDMGPDAALKYHPGAIAAYKAAGL